MQLIALLPVILTLASGAAASSPAPQPRAVGIISAALDARTPYVPVQLQKRQNQQNQDSDRDRRFDLVFPQVCVADCQRMVDAAGQMAAAAYAVGAIERDDGRVEPDLDDDRISDATRNGLCTTETVRSILTCVNCAYGNGVPNLSEDDAEDVIDWFEDFCDDTQAWEAIDDDDEDDVTAQRTATGPFTTATNLQLPAGFTDYPRVATRTVSSSPSGSAGGGAASSNGSPRPTSSTGSPTTAGPGSQSSVPAGSGAAQPSSAALPNVAVQGGLGVVAALGVVLGALL